MSLPETCPFCGAEPYTTASGEQCRGGDRWVLFSCDTSIYAGQDLRRTQSRKCEDAERTRLAARVAELEAREKQAREDEAWAKQNLAYVSMGEDGCWAGIYDRDASEERGLVERVDTIADALSALRDMAEGGAR